MNRLISVFYEKVETIKNPLLYEIHEKQKNSNNNIKQNDEKHLLIYIYYVIMKCLLFKKHTVDTNLNAPNSVAAKDTQKELLKLHGKLDKKAILVGYINMPMLESDLVNRK